MSFSSVKGLGFPPVSQHLKIQRGALTIKRAYHPKKCPTHLFLLLQAFVNSENLSYGFRNNLLCTSFLPCFPRSLLMLLFSVQCFISVCFHVCLLLWRVCSARLGDGIYLSCGPRIVSDLHVPVHVY